MALNIKVSYPELSDVVTQQDLVTLQRFEQSIKEKIVFVTDSTSDYRWEHASQTQGDRSYSLVKTIGSKVVETFPIRFLNTATPEDLIEMIRVNQMFPLIR